MLKKPKVSKKKLKKPKKKLEFFCDDNLFDENLSVIKIEHCFECPIFAEKAQEIFKILSDRFPRNKFKLLMNVSEVDGKKFEPNYGAFEISFAKNCREVYHLIWSGIDKGPPRREKFPANLNELANKINKFLAQ